MAEPFQSEWLERISQSPKNEPTEPTKANRLGDLSNEELLEVARDFVERVKDDPRGDRVAVLILELSSRLDKKAREVKSEAVGVTVGVTDKQPHELGLHQFGVYRVEPPGYDAQSHRAGKGKGSSGPSAHYTRYLRVPGGWIIEMEVPEFPRAGLRPTFVPEKDTQRPALT